MRPTPLWLLPVNWNANENEGREAFAAGRDITDHPFGDCSAAKDFERGWRQAELRSREKTR